METGRCVPSEVFSTLQLRTSGGVLVYYEVIDGGPVSVSLAGALGGMYHFVCRMHCPLRLSEVSGGHVEIGTYDARKACVSAVAKDTIYRVACVGSPSVEAVQ